MVELADLCDELKKCYEMVTEQERRDCFCRVDRLMDEYFGAIQRCINYPCQLTKGHEGRCSSATH